MKSGRLLAMLLLLQAKGRLSARQLAAQLEVSQRTVYRDLDALSSAGVPVHAERGVTGGIVLADGYRRALTQFDEDEIRALFIAGDNLLADIGIEDRRPNALEKLAGALPEAQLRAVEAMRGRVYLDQRRWWQAAPPREHLAVLRVAVWEDRRVELHYRDQTRKVSVRIVDPLGLVAKAGIWYLVARYGSEMRTFRADRILDVTKTDQHFERPDGFDLRSYWHEWATKFERTTPGYPVMLRVAREAHDDIMSGLESRILDDSPRSETLFVRVLFSTIEAAVHHILSWGRKVEIVEPNELRERVIARAREALDHHDQLVEVR